MKALTHTRYGSPDVLELVDLPKADPANDQILLKVHAASVNPLDYHLLRGEPIFARPFIGGLRKPRVTRPGRDVAGVVEAVGRNITRLKPGDAVFGTCLGAFAEYVCAAEDRFVLKPADVSFDEAAAMPVAAVTALQGLRDKGHIQPGRRVLVDGASGGVGTYAVQIAKTFGAEVTAVCSTRKLDTARSLGADHVIDYTQEDFTRSGLQYDLILAANAYHSILDYRRALSPNGKYVMVGGGEAQTLQIMLVGPLLSLSGSKKMGFFIAKLNRADLEILKDLLASRKVVSVIDRRYPLSAAADAFRYLEEGHARGKVIITFEAQPE